MKIIGVFDDPRFMDRYTVVLDRVEDVDGDRLHHMLSTSINPQLPSEVSHYGLGRFYHSDDNSHLGDNIPFHSLSQKIQDNVMERLKEMDEILRWRESRPYIKRLMEDEQEV